VNEDVSYEPNFLGAEIGLPLLPGDRAFVLSVRNGSDPFL
jgi:hypothetical protein